MSGGDGERQDEAVGAAALQAGHPEVAVVLPTYNERDNLEEVIRRVGVALHGVAWEVVVVDDDSPDETWKLAHEIAERDARVRCIRRIGRRGLAGACIEGMLSATAPVVAVMDADLQHDETLLPRMLARLKAGDADLVVASRFLEGSATDGLTAQRRAASGIANGLARIALGARLSDPMSGFFMLPRARVEAIAHRLSPQGFKILLDIIVSSRPRLRIAELPFVFRERIAGESKLDSVVMFEFLGLVLSKLVGGVVGVRFVLFGWWGFPASSCTSRRSGRCSPSIFPSTRDRRSPP